MAKSGVLHGFRTWFIQPFKRKGKSVWRVFVLCFLTATVFWVFNSLNKTYTTTILYPIEIQYDSEDFIPVSELPEHTEIQVTGFGWDLLKWSFHFGLKPMPIDPKNYAKTAFAVSDYQDEIVENLGQVKLNAFINDSVAMNFDQKISKKIALTVDTNSFSLKNDFILSEKIQISPDSIILVGPKSILQNFRNSISVKINENDISSNFSENVSLDFKSNPLIKTDLVEVTVNLKVTELVAKSVSLNVLKLNFPSDTFTLSSDHVTLNLKVIKSDNSTVPLDSIKVIADYKYLNSKSSNIPLRLENIPSSIFQPKLDSDSIKINL